MNVHEHCLFFLKKNMRKITFMDMRALLLFLTMQIAMINGERVKIPETLNTFLATLESYQKTQNDVVFLLDDSGSIEEKRFPDVKNFSKLIAQHLSVSPNYNRIAILTFSTGTITHIDYIQNPGGNACTLAMKIDQIGYTAGGTQTSTAMEMADGILARGTSPNKIVILLTDGQSNTNYSPVSIAKVMRSKGIIIFAIGVADVNKEEIDGVASSKNHTYILENFSLIKEANDDLVGDLTDDILDEEKELLCNFKCDSNAKCYCGTRTGKYECICNAGYYGSDGKEGQCQKCPKGTYKETSTNTNCTACPKYSTTNNEGGSVSFEDCECDSGYEKVGKTCKPVTCASLSAPKGGFLVPKYCQNTYGSTCSFHCQEGYCPFSCASYAVVRPNGNHSLLPYRTCLENREWSNNEFLCEKITCASLNSPLNGYYKCSDGFVHGSNCKFSCDKGYELYGSRSRFCEFGLWTGEDVKCKVRHCDQLKTNSLLQVKPSKCASEPRPFRSICTYYCTHGYRLVLYDGVSKSDKLTDGVLECGADTKWSVVPGKLSCKDKDPPKITCPSSIKVNTDPQKGFASNVIWEEPTTTDNVAVKSVILIEPKGFNKMFVFPINKTKVVYEATDTSKLKETCSFVVEVIDNEPPQVISCPQDIIIFNDSNKAVPVTWHGPIFKDNSGSVTYTSNRTSGDKFGWGPPSIVKFTALDPSNNIASCSFTIIVKPFECPYYRPPANGLLTCDDWNYGKLCSIFCHNDFEFTTGRDFDGPYFCQKNKIWVHFKTKKIMKNSWPDCSRKLAPISFNVSAGISYTVDSCSDQILRQMRKRFIDIAKKLPSALCPKSACSPENVRVTCNPIEIQRKRRSTGSDYIHQRLNSDYSSKISRTVREAMKQTLTISFDIMLSPNDTDENFGTNQTNETRSDDQNAGFVNSILKTVENKISLEVKDIYHLTSVPNPLVDYGITAICSIGQIKVNNSCIYCPPGTYKEDVSETCIDCPQASYQDEEGKLSCKPCPIGHTTYGVKSKSSNDCKGPCQPGTHSKTTFEPCFACPLNTYQDRSMRKDCVKCHPGFYTWRVGANSSMDCVAPCMPGTFSDTGYEPCILCDVGFFQDKEMQKNCSVCPYGKSTARKGSRSVKECKEIDICNDLRPCHPSSTCIQYDKEYECMCPEGLLGKNCEINFNDCEKNPCFNHGSCVDLIGDFSCLCTVGWTGKQCEINIDDCASNPCFNSGVCIDKLNAYECECMPGFTDERCERNIYECESNPCLNNGTCFDKLNGYRCCCAKGYVGVNCENKSDSNICDTVICENGGICFAKDENFTCSCLPGFDGSNCEFNVDDCKDFLCDNGGTCVDGINIATCNCPLPYTGLYCQEVLQSEFFLSFSKPITSNYVKVENKHRLPAITVAFYMRTSNKDPTSRATPVSYSYKYQNDVVDNALTFYDTNKFVLYIHGHEIHTGYSANRDAEWHHYAVTWGKMHGSWTFYVDGNIIESGTVAEDKYMYPGVFILGQEQDDIGGRFSTLEAFVGDITEFNVWDYALTKDEIKSILSSCGHIGNVISWYKVRESIHGEVYWDENVDKCQTLGPCPGNSCDCIYANKTEVGSCKYDVEKCVDENTCSNGQPCIASGRHSFCNCSEGFEGRHCEYDVNECIQANGGCSHSCVNAMGTYRCECPQDMLLSEDGKICKDANYCLKDDTLYMDGEVWMSLCQNCACTKGSVKCEEIVCNEVICHETETKVTFPGECCPKCIAWSFCFVSPNNTIMSFDMSTYEVEGECIYTAVEECIEGSSKVLIESFQNSTNGMNLVIYQDCSKLVISSNGNVLLDDKIVSIPYFNEEFLIEDSNSTISVKTKSDFLVQWDFVNEAIIGVPVSSGNKICGLCSKIDEYYIYGTGKFPLSERYSSVRKFSNDVFIFIL